MTNVFVIGSKGIPANYGGFETFVEKLTEKKVHQDIKYHVSCLADNDREFQHNGARCFNVNMINFKSSAKAVLYDIESIRKCVDIIRNEKPENPIVYVLACRMGPVFGHYCRVLHKLGARVYINPDGLEWKRSKWNSAIRAYWKYSFKQMVKRADLSICDSLEIERMIQDEYPAYHANTTYISYGADIPEANAANAAAADTPETKQLEEKLLDWYLKHELRKNDYYVTVGRFVPENNLETIIREYLLTKTDKKLVIITDLKQNKFYSQLQQTGFEKDKRVKFVGTVYDQALLTAIRVNAYAYIHGHEVGGTNPSLLEALATTKVNILYDVPFNHEVGMDGALYFDKTPGALAATISTVEGYDSQMRDALGIAAQKRIREAYLWDDIIRQYEALFLRRP